MSQSSQHTPRVDGSTPRSGLEHEPGVVDIMNTPRLNPARSSVEAFAESRRQSHTTASLADVQGDGVSVGAPVLDDAQGEQSQPDVGIDFDLLQNWILNSRIAKGFEEEGLSADKSTREPSSTIPPEVRQLPTEGVPPCEKSNSSILNQPDPKGTSRRGVHQPRFTFFSSASESTIHGSTFADLFSPGDDVRKFFSDSVWWLNVREPSKGEVSIICKALGIHPLTTEDITTQEQREKIEIFSSYYFASLRSFRTAKHEHRDEFDPVSVYVIVFRQGILTFQSVVNENDHASSVRNKISSLKDHVSLSSDWLCYALIDDIVDSFAPSIRKLESQTDAIEDEVFFVRDSASSNSLLRDIGRLRKNCLSLMRLVGGKADVLRSFTKRCNQDYKMMPRTEIGLFLGDVQDHVVTMVGNLSHYDRILARSHSNCLAQLSITNIEQGISTNRTLNKITLLASIIVPMHLVTGLWGMNVRVPFQEDRVDSLAPFFTIIAAMVLFCGLILGWAHRLRIL
ncbi:hypothetical protein ACJ41O_006199 [Fusarium nematophilum]